MGTTESKPDYVSEQKWEKFQEEKMAAVRQEQANLAEIRKENKNNISKLLGSFNNYCQKCQDVPLPLMLFKSYRTECGEARAELLNNLGSVATGFKSETDITDIMYKIKSL